MQSQSGGLYAPLHACEIKMRGRMLQQTEEKYAINMAEIAYQIKYTDSSKLQKQINRAPVLVPWVCGTLE